MASLSRAFTTRRNVKVADISTPMPKRSLTTKHSYPPGTIRNKISAPVELISTTNMLSYNAPDIYPNKSPSSSRSSNSGDESDRSPTSVSTPMTSPDTSSIESSPTSLEPNHLSCYFGGPSRQSASSEEAPLIPQRATSHTKKTAEALARKRSVSRMSSPKNSISSRLSSPKNSMSVARSSLNMFAANVETVNQHPFGNELAQVSEIAEEYGISQEKMSIVDKEEQELMSLGLFKFAAEDYMSEIHGLFISAFGDVASHKPIHLYRDLHCTYLSLGQYPGLYLSLHHFVDFHILWADFLKARGRGGAHMGRSGMMDDTTRELAIVWEFGKTSHVHLLGDICNLYIFSVHKMLRVETWGTIDLPDSYRLKQ
jgi:hypothetical protein